ncbi:MAG: protein-disulfide reductase DsbD, partial [Burkholderiaceae bacterium]
FLAPEQAFRLSVARSGNDVMALTWSIAPGYYLYRDRFSAAASPSGARLTPRLPPGVRKDDPTFGATEIYHDAVTMTVSPAGAAALDITWQGCAEAGLCYPPQSQRIAVATTLAATPASTPLVAPRITSSETQNKPTEAASFDSWRAGIGSDMQITKWLGEHALGLTLPLFFMLGIALAFTPCVLPMLPIVSGMLVGSQAPPRRAFALSLAFVLPMALTYAALGVAAALAGANLQAMLQNRWTVLLLGGVYAVLAFGMFGLFTLQLPTFLRNRLDRASRAQSGGTFGGAIVLGVLSALLVGPCMTAPLAGALLYIAQSGNAGQGALLLFALGLGMGTPLVVIGTLGARFLPRPGPWMERVKTALGFVLLGTAVWMLERVVAAPLVLLMWGGLLLAVALTLWHEAKSRRDEALPSRPLLQLTGRTLAVVVGLWGSAMVLGAAGGAADPWRPLQFAGTPVGGASAVAVGLRFEPIGSEAELQQKLAEARASGQPTVVDFYADWCVSCKVIEERVFGDPQVQRALAGTRLLRADITANAPNHQAFMRAHDVVGPPTVMLFDAEGRERRAARGVGEFSATEFLQRLGSVKGADGLTFSAMPPSPGRLATALSPAARRFPNPLVGTSIHDVAP